MSHNLSCMSHLHIFFFYQMFRCSVQKMKRPCLVLVKYSTECLTKASIPMNIHYICILFIMLNNFLLFIHMASLHNALGQGESTLIIFVPDHHPKQWLCSEYNRNTCTCWVILILPNRKTASSVLIPVVPDHKVFLIFMNQWRLCCHSSSKSI